MKKGNIEENNEIIEKTCELTKNNVIKLKKTFSSENVKRIYDEVHRLSYYSDFESEKWIYYYPDRNVKYNTKETFLPSKKEG